MSFPGGALDREAVDRGNSVYLVDRVLPMLPEQLSNGICSLKPGVDRLTRAVVLRFDPEGRRTGARFISSVIKSACRLTYEEAYDRMMEEEPRPDDVITRLLQEAWRLASVLRGHRFKAGALDMEFAEVRPILDKEGKPVRLARIEYDESHQLIEEFMLAANEAVAERTRSAGVPAIYRVHEDPDPERLLDFRTLVRSFGVEVGDLTVRHEVRRLLKAVRGRPEEHAIKVGLLKSLKRALYHADPLGHYGLAKTDYTHFTSPIRRYADLVVHRVVWNLMHSDDSDVQRRTPTHKGMQEIADHISATERTASDAELETRRLKELEYLAGLVDADSRVTFEAMITEVRKMGAFVELTDYFIKGLVKPEGLRPRDHYTFDRSQLCFYGEQTRGEFRAGDRVTVAVDSVDLERKFVNFRVVGAS